MIKLVLSCEAMQIVVCSVMSQFSFSRLCIV